MKTRVVKLHSEHDLRIDTEEVAALGPDDVLVRVHSGGICGSDLHYFHHGGIGDVRVKDPIILGHETSGTVEKLGASTEHGLKIGDQVSLNPSRACNQCDYCRAGLQQHCYDMLFFGSAMRRPHVQGAFRDLIAVPASQCFKVKPATPLSHAAVAEPLAVCLHAANRLSELRGKKVIITGAGPIGSLCAVVARYQGAAEVVITDIEPHTLSIAKEMGATLTVNVATHAQDLQKFKAGVDGSKGYFDCAFECSGVAQAQSQAISMLKPQGELVQVGLAAEMPVPFNQVVPREISISGSFRFHEEFATAVELIDNGAIDVAPLITESIPMESAEAAFALAGDRSQAVKVLLTFAAG